MSQWGAIFELRRILGEIRGEYQGRNIVLVSYNIKEMSLILFRLGLPITQLRNLVRIIDPWRMARSTVPSCPTRPHPWQLFCDSRILIRHTDLWNPGNAATYTLQAALVLACKPLIRYDRAGRRAFLVPRSEQEAQKFELIRYLISREVGMVPALLQEIILEHPARRREFARDGMDVCGEMDVDSWKLINVF